MARFAPIRRPLGCTLLLLLAVCASAAETTEYRFPRPQFESGYTVPTTPAPAPRASAFAVLDAAVLATTLFLASYLALRQRSRRALALLSTFSLLYFGFWRLGCVCAVGATQNVAAALFDASAVLPAAVAAFFVLPLVTALFAGRTFCAAGCPLGAVQDLVVLWPVRVPGAAEAALGLLPQVYLGLAVLFASTGAGFVVCRYDPFVAFFRLSGPPGLLLAGGFLLTLGAFVARPYCRYLCPYGVLLGWASRLSRRHATVTTDLCVRCRLCEGSCPFGALRVPAPPGDPEDRGGARRRLAALLLLLPVLAGAGALLGAAVHPALALTHPTVRLARDLDDEERGAKPTLAAEAFREGTATVESLRREAEAVSRRFRTGAAILGSFLGLVFGGRLLRLSVWRAPDHWEPDRGACLSCGRCFDSCPVEHLRRQYPEGEYRRLAAALREPGAEP